MQAMPALGSADLIDHGSGQVGELSIMPYCTRSASVKSRNRWEQRYGMAGQDLQFLAGLRIPCRRPGHGPLTR